MGVRMNTKFEDLEVYQIAFKLSDLIWNIVILWNQFAKDTIGKQLVKASDSVGANIAEGSGRGSYSDNHRFLKISRGSLFETKHWLKRAEKRRLLNENDYNKLYNLVEDLIPRLSAYMTYVKKRSKK